LNILSVLYKNTSFFNFESAGFKSNSQLVKTLLRTSKGRRKVEILAGKRNKKPHSTQFTPWLQFLLSLLISSAKPFAEIPVTTPIEPGHPEIVKICFPDL